MKLLNSSLTTSVFSLGNGGYSTAEALLPSDALVIVIQDRPDSITPPPVLAPPQWQNSHRPPSKPFPVLRSIAEKAYSEQRHVGIPIINVSG